MKFPTLISWNFAAESSSSQDVLDVHFTDENGRHCISTFTVDYDEKITLHPRRSSDDADEDLLAEVVDDLLRYNSNGYAKPLHFDRSPEAR